MAPECIVVKYKHSALGLPSFHQEFFSDFEGKLPYCQGNPRQFNSTSFQLQLINLQLNMPFTPPRLQSIHMLFEILSFTGYRQDAEYTLRTLCKALKRDYVDKDQDKLNLVVAWN